MSNCQVSQELCQRVRSLTDNPEELARELRRFEELEPHLFRLATIDMLTIIAILIDDPVGEEHLGAIRHALRVLVASVFMGMRLLPHGATEGTDTVSRN